METKFNCDYCNDEFIGWNNYKDDNGCACTIWKTNKNKIVIGGCGYNSIFDTWSFRPTKNSIIKFKPKTEICDNCLSELIVTDQIINRI
jgi:hypothetical protein